MTRPSGVEDVLDQLGITVHSSGRELSASCPFHTDRHPSFSVNATSGLWVCYSCGRGGTLSMLIKAVGGSDADPGVVLREIRHSQIGKKAKEAPQPEPDEAPPDPLFIYAKYAGYEPPPQWALDARSLGSGSAERYGLKWDKGWVIPIWAPEITDEQASLWGWQWKRLSVVSNWPGEVKKSHTLFGLRELGLYGDMSTVALVESPLDVVRLASVNVGAVAAYGAFVSKVQLQLLIHHADRIVLALDNDDAGNQQATKVYPYLARHVPTSRAVLPDGCKDPGDMDDDQIEEAFNDVQGRATPVPTRRRRHDADPALTAPRSRPRAR